VHTYFGRIYEARFLTGIIAGSLTRTNKIGYVGSYPVKGVISGVNAFALGARMVNPKAKVHVTWAYQWDFAKTEPDYSTRLAELGCDLVSHQNTFTGVGYEGEYGLYSLSCEHGCAPDEYIATPVWNWGVFYELMVRQFLAAGGSSEARPTQFWWGLSSGIVDVMYAKRIVPLETHKLVGVFKNLMKEGLYNPFTGPIFDRDGAERIPADASADAQQIINMDWFVDGIEGEVPQAPADWQDTGMTSELLEL
jgi:basic membrane lipoprotein Med (substrate-binding protein (PBP1-ABC) superfamily)